MKYGNIIPPWDSECVTSVFSSFSQNSGQGGLKAAHVWMLPNTWPVTNPNIKQIQQRIDLSLQ